MKPSALLPGVKRSEVFAWAMYDFANSGYTTVVLTAVFATYFVGVVAGGAPWATLLWTASLSLSHAIVMLAMPVVGAWCDRHAKKKSALWLSTLVCVLGTFALGWAGPGDLAWAVLWVVVSNVAYSAGEALIAAFLPELAKPEAMGKVSGWGWAWGYVGGMLTLALCLFWVIRGMGQGGSAAEVVPPTLWITAMIFLTAGSYTFLRLPERAQPQRDASGRAALSRSWHTLRDAARWAHARRPVWRLLQCIVAYQAGVAVAIAVAAIYAEGEMGMSKQDTMMLIFLLNIAALAGAWGLGWLQDHLGHVRTLRWTLWGWVMVCLLAALSPNVSWFWVACAIAGFCMGASQSIGRAMVARLTPPERTAQMFALWSVAMRMAAIVGPLLYGLVTWGSGGQQRLAIAVTSLLFLLGLWILSRIDWDEAVEQAERDRVGST
jgi:UMF1 family MFS transporter